MIILDFSIKTEKYILSLDSELRVKLIDSLIEDIEKGSYSIDEVRAFKPSDVENYIKLYLN